MDKEDILVKVLSGLCANPNLVDNELLIELSDGTRRSGKQLVKAARQITETVINEL